jgi:hypothetical protein
MPLSFRERVFGERRPGEGRHFVGRFIDRLLGYENGHPVTRFFRRLFDMTLRAEENARAEFLANQNNNNYYIGAECLPGIAERISTGEIFVGMVSDRQALFMTLGVPTPGALPAGAAAGSNGWRHPTMEEITRPIEECCSQGKLKGTFNPAAAYSYRDAWSPPHPEPPQPYNALFVIVPGVGYVHKADVPQYYPPKRVEAYLDPQKLLVRTKAVIPVY